MASSADARAATKATQANNRVRKVLDANDISIFLALDGSQMKRIITRHLTGG